VRAKPTVWRFNVSDGMSFVTGQSLVHDGGLLAGPHPPASSPPSVAGRVLWATVVRNNNGARSDCIRLEEHRMKAIVHTQYGAPDVLQFKEVTTPTPADNQVLIKLYAASVNPMDWHFMRGKPWLVRLVTGVRAPKYRVLGCDIAGRVAAVGRHVTQFQPGDEVFGGIGVGGFAEYACAVEDKLALKPADLSFEDAAAAPVAASTALQGLRDKGRIQPGCKVLVDGASGGVGTFAVQIAKAFGAEVTAVCSTRKIDTARSIGADHVIDYTREDFTRSGKRYNLILGANAYHSIFDYWRSLSQDGIYVAAGGGSQSVLGILFSVLLRSFLSLIGSKKMFFFLANINKKDLLFLSDLLEARKVVPVIDRRYPLSDVAEALRYLEEGHAQGKVVITVDHSNDA
jgi:NADPH:quinone reductase-like Zn-dependent oxidoreductase